MKLVVVVSILSLVLLSACGQASLTEPTLALTVVPTASSTSTLTPIPTNTNTPEPTSTETLKQFKECSAENYMDCYIPSTDLGKNGAYFKYLEQLPKLTLATPDPSNVSTCRPDHFYYRGVFVAGFRFGYTEGNVFFDNSSRHTTFVVAPVEFPVPQKPGETKKVIFVIEKPIMPESEWISWLQHWAEHKVLRMAGFDGNKINNSFEKQTLSNFPDIAERVCKFQQTFDPTSISEPGIVLETFIVR